MKKPRISQPVTSRNNELLSKDNIKDRVCALAEEISNTYQNKELMIVSVLSGAVRFTADLLSHIENIAVRITFVEAESYRNTSRPGYLRFGSLAEENIRGREILIVDDILDTGRTLSKLTSMLKIFEPKSVETCVLLRKNLDRGSYDLIPRFVGFDIENEFVVGYGMDYEGLYRDINCITVMKEDSQ